MSLMGIDIGTSGCKVLVVSLDGRIIAQAGASYTVHENGEDRYELDPREVWQKIQSCIRSCNSSCEKDPVEALSFSTQGEAVVPVDSRMKPLSPAPVSADLRGLRYVGELAHKFGEKVLKEITGQQLDPIHSIFKIKWWSEQQQQIFNKCWKYCCFDTFVYLCLGLPPVTDRSMAARMMLYDITRDTWSEPLMAYLGIDAGKLPEIIPSGVEVGKLSKDVSYDLGFSICPTVISGGHDQPCAAFGNGMVDEGISYSIGTTECISVIRKQVDVDTPENERPTYPHVIPERMVTLVGSQTGTRFFNWLGGLLFDRNSSRFPQHLEDFYDLIRAVPSSLKTSVIILPHMFGGSSHYANPHAKAHMSGFSHESKAEDFIKAAMEGITIEQYLGFEKFLHLSGLKESEAPIIATGGGVRFENWVAIKADIFHRPFQLMATHEAGCIGAAMLAGIGIHTFSTPTEAVDAYVEKTQLIQPNESMKSYYDNKIEHFDELYHSVNELKHRR